MAFYLRSRLQPARQKTPFRSKRAPKISLEAYIARLAKYSRVGPETHVHALIYLQRLLQQLDGVSLCHENVFKLYFIALVLASKYNEDRRLSNEAFEKVGGVKVAEIAVLEILFLKWIRFRLEVTPESFQRQLRELLVK